MLKDPTNYYHGIVELTKDLQLNFGKGNLVIIPKGTMGIITAFLPEEKIIAVYFREGNICTFNMIPSEFVEDHGNIFLEGTPEYNMEIRRLITAAFYGIN